MPVVDANLNALWCRAIAEELARCGVAWCVLCPGSRNSPLIFALLADGSLRAISQVDERSAGFLALGIAKSMGRPVVVCVTSGSAVANLLPAIVEAHASGVRLVVLSADRPWEMHEVGSPQTMPQRGIFSPFLAGELDLGEPLAEDHPLRALRARLSRLVQTARGPVVINVPMRDPLPPLADATWRTPPLAAEALQGRADGHPYTRLLGEPAAGASAPIAALVSQWERPSWLRPGLRGVIVAGANLDAATAAVAEHVVQVSGFPLIADAPSHLRRAAWPGVISCADALLSAGDAPLAELVIQLGSAPLARTVVAWLERHRCPWLAVDGGASRDATARAWAVLPASAPHAGWLAAACAPGDPGWRERWVSADHRAWSGLRAAMPTEPWGEVLAAHLACTHAGFGFLHLASSMAVRHGNLHCHASLPSRPIHANRGLNGIDGTLATFLGECLAQPSGDLPARPGLLLCGDLAFLHDLPALAAAQAARRPATPPLRGAIVVLNNGGGGIFDFLSVSQVPESATWIRTSQTHDLAAAAAQFTLPFQRVASAEALSQVLDAASQGPLTLIECVVPGGCVERHRLLVETMAGSWG